MGSPSLGAAVGLIFCLRERELREGSIEVEGGERERREKRLKKMERKRKYNKIIFTGVTVNC
jgi:hypothetical protein